MGRRVRIAAASLLLIHSTGLGQPLFPLDGRVIRGELTLEDQAALPPDHPRQAPGFGRVVHVVSAETGVVVELTLQADFDTLLVLLGPGGEVVAENDDFRDLHTSRVTHRLTEPGPHRAIVTSFSLGVEGDYLLAARRVSEESDLAGAFSPLVDDMLWEDLREGDRLDGQEQSGELTEGLRSELPPRAPPFPEGVALSTHALAVTRECIQSFELWAEFDGVLTLLAPNGTRLARNDDHRMAERSRIDDVRFRIPGEYLLVVSGHASGEIGPYTLIIGTPRSPESDQSG